MMWNVQKSGLEKKLYMCVFMLNFGNFKLLYLRNHSVNRAKNRTSFDIIFVEIDSRIGILWRFEFFGKYNRSSCHKF